MEANSINFLKVSHPNDPLPSRWESCAVLSKKSFILNEYAKETGDHSPDDPSAVYHNLLPAAPPFSYNRPRYVTVGVRTKEADGPLFYLSCIHLSPKYPNLRLEEIARVSEDLAPLIDGGAAQLWTGDLNTLTQADYTAEEWEHIVKIRKENGRNLPTNDVIDFLTGIGFHDNW